MNKRELGHIYLIFITVYYKNSILLLIIVNLLLCITYKFKLYHSRYVQEKTVQIGFDYPWFQQSVGRLGMYPCGWGTTAHYNLDIRCHLSGVQLVSILVSQIAVIPNDS